MSLERPNKRGRKAMLCIDEQIKVYEKFSDEIVDENGKIRPASASVFKVISGQIKMTPKAIQLAISKNAEKFLGDKYKKDDKNKDEINSESDDEQVVFEDMSGVTITIRLSEMDYHQFGLIKYEGPKKTYMSLRPGWAPKLFSIIARESGTKCNLTFKRVDVVGSEFKATGYCKECNGNTYVHSTENRTKLLVQVIEGKQAHTFTTKRRLAKERATELVSHLNSDTVHNVHMSIVNGLDIDAEHLPRDFVTHKLLENLKYRTNTYKDSALTELRKMKYMPQYGAAIKEICSDPFRLHFWTTEQVFYYNQIKKRQRTCMSFDATGGIVSRSSILQDIKHCFEVCPETPHIFLYLLCVKNKDGISVPVGQMLSASQDSITISHFLARWAHEFSIPDEFVCDDSLALQKSIVLSCTRFKSVGAYVSCCFALLEGNDVALPECYLRLDIPHYIKNWNNDKVFNKVDKRLKHYYLCVLGVIVQSEDYDAIKSIVKNILMIANYPTLSEIEI